MSEKFSSRQFYEDKGKVRHMVIFSNINYCESLKNIAKKYGVTQGEVVEALLDNIGPQVDSALNERRILKEKERAVKSSVSARLKKLTPEQLFAMEAMLDSSE